MAEPMRPVPSQGGGGGGRGRLSSLPTPVKIGGAVGIAVIAYILWKRHQANASGSAASNASSTTTPYGSTTVPGNDYGMAPGGLAPPLMGYNPTGQIIGYDNNGNPIYGVTPPGSTGTNTFPPTTPTPGIPGNINPGGPMIPAAPPTPASIPTPVSPSGEPAPTLGSSGQPLPGNPSYIPANAIALPQPTQNSFAGTMASAATLPAGQTGYLPNGLRVKQVQEIPGGPLVTEYY